MKCATVYYSVRCDFFYPFCRNLNTAQPTEFQGSLHRRGGARIRIILLGPQRDPVGRKQKPRVAAAARGPSGAGRPARLAGGNRGKCLDPQKW